MSVLIKSSTTLALICVLAAAYLINFSQQVHSTPLNGDEELMPADDGSFFLAPADCAKDEEPNAGKLPECEPTCENPRPVCLKIFYAGLDIAPCFCKKPLVRNTKTKACVRLDECPHRQHEHHEHRRSHKHVV